MSRSIYESELVWTRSIVRNKCVAIFICFLVGDHSVAQTNSFDEVEKVLVIFMRLVINIVEVFVILKINIGYPESVLLLLRIIVSILIFTGRKAFKLHDVLS